MSFTTKRIIYTVAISVISTLMSACSTTHYVENWKAQDYEGPALRKILVIGVINGEDNRRKFEDQFTKLITSNEITGISSYTLIANLEKHGNKENVLAAVEKTNADGVLIVTTHGVSGQDRVTRGSVDYIPNMRSGYGMFGYYNRSHSFIYTQGNTVTDSVLRIDTKLYNANTEEMIWSAKTESFNPTSSETIIMELEALVVDDMRASGMIK